MDTEKLGKLIISIVIIGVSAWVLAGGLKSYYSTYMSEEEQNAFKEKINKKLFFIIPVGVLFFITFVWLLYALIIDKNAFLIIEDLFEKIVKLLKKL